MTASIRSEPISAFTILSEHVHQRDEKAIREIIEKAQIEETWLKNYGDQQAVYRACSEAIFLKESAIVDLFLAAGVKPTTTVKVWKHGYNHPNLSYFAAKAGDLSRLQQLLNSGLAKSMTDLMFRDNSAICGAVEGNQPEVLAYLLQAGASPNGALPRSYNEEPLIFYALRQHFYTISALLVDYGVHIIHAIEALKRYVHYQIEYGKKTAPDTLRASYTEKLRDLFDVAIGYDIPAETKEKFILYDIDVSGFNFVGLSYAGKPLTAEFLQAHHVKGWENAFFTTADFIKISDLARRERLQQRLVEVQKRVGELVNAAGVVNVVPLIHAAAVGDIAAVQARLQANVHPDNNNHYHPQSISHETPHPIILAAQNGHLKVVQLLVNTQLVDEKHYVEACAKARHYGYIAIVNWLQPKIPTNARDQKGRTLIYHAASYGDHAIVDELALAGNDVNIPDNNTVVRNTPLYVAVSYYKNAAYFETIKILLRHKAAVYYEEDGHHYSPCFDNLLGKRFHLNVFSLLMPQYRADDASLSWHLAHALEHQEAVAIYALYVANGISLNIEWNKITILNRAMSDALGSRLRFSIKLKDGIMQSLHGENVTEDDIVQAHQAVARGSMLIHFLIHNGTNINLANTEDGMTSLHTLMRFKKENGWDIQNFLYVFAHYQAQLDAQDHKGNSALHYAVLHNNYEALEFLLSHGASTNLVNKDKQTPLHVAIAQRDRNLQAIKSLIAHTDLTLKNSQDETPLEMLERINREKPFEEYAAIKAMLATAPEQKLLENNLTVQSHSLFRQPVNGIDSYLPPLARLSLGGKR